MGMGSGGENTYFAKVLCQLENRPCDISVMTVKPADSGQTQTSETWMECKTGQFWFMCFDNNIPRLI